MGDHGIRYVRKDIDKVKNYIERMVEAGRVMTMTDEEGLHTVLFFSVCDDPEKYLKKDTWDYTDHEPNGACFYVEKIVTKKWSVSLRKKVEALATQLYPAFSLGKWHRWGRIGDRGVTVRRRNYV